MECCKKVIPTVGLYFPWVRSAAISSSRPITVSTPLMEVKLLESSPPLSSQALFINMLTGKSKRNATREPNAQVPKATENLSLAVCFGRVTPLPELTRNVFHLKTRCRAFVYPCNLFGPALRAPFSSSFSRQSISNLAFLNTNRYRVHRNIITNNKIQKQRSRCIVTQGQNG